MLFLDDAPVELVALDFLFFELGVAPGLEGGEALVEPARAAAIEPDGRAGEVGEQPPVVADHREGRARLRQFLLQPFDRDEVEMVGRLVEQQNVGIGGEDPRERRAARLAARQLRGIGAAGRRRDRPSAPARDRGCPLRRGRSARNPASSHSPSDRAPAADSAGARWAGRSASRRRRRFRRRRSSAASICPSRCGRPARFGRPAKSSIPRPRAAARRRGSGECLAIAIEAAYEANSARRGGPNA